MADRPSTPPGPGPSRGPRGSDRPGSPPKPARRSPSEPRPSQEGGRGGAAAGGRAHPARWEPEGLSPGLHPRSVTPGIENQPDENRLPPPGVYVGLDWMRFTGPEDVRGELLAMLEALFGSDFEGSGGAKHYKHGLVWKPGVLLSWGHSHDVCQVDIQGGRLRLMSGDYRIALFRRLMEKGIRPTRIDGAMDFIDEGLNVCENAEASCRRGEHCLLRKWSPNNEYQADGTPTRLLLKLGARESAICARIYDKGLEQKAATIGRWERLEIEWKHDRAEVVGQELYNSVYRDGWAPKLTSLILGAVDFREKTGRTELDRRPRVAWWEQVIAGHETVTVAPAMEPRTFERWRDGFVRSYGRRLVEMAESVGVTVGDLASKLLDGVDPSDTGGELVAQFEQAFRSLAPE